MKNSRRIEEALGLPEGTIQDSANTNQGGYLYFVPPLAMGEVKLYEFPGISDFISPSSEIFVGGDFTTPAEVSRMQKSSACPWCGNSSGETDSRGMCASCGGDLGHTAEYPKPIIDWKI